MTEETEDSVILPKTKLGQEDKRIRRGKTEGEEGKEGRNLFLSYFLYKYSHLSFTF